MVSPKLDLMGKNGREQVSRVLIHGRGLRCTATIWLVAEISIYKKSIHPKHWQFNLKLSSNIGKIFNWEKKEVQWVNTPSTFVKLFFMRTLQLFYGQYNWSFDIAFSIIYNCTLLKHIYWFYTISILS